MPSRHVVVRRPDTSVEASDGRPTVVADSRDTCKIEHGDLRLLVEGSQPLPPILDEDLQIEVSSNEQRTQGTPPPWSRESPRFAYTIRRTDAVPPARPAEVPGEIEDEEEQTFVLKTLPVIPTPIPAPLPRSTRPTSSDVPIEVEEPAAAAPTPIEPELSARSHAELGADAIEDAPVTELEAQEPVVNPPSRATALLTGLFLGSLLLAIAFAATQL